MQFIGWRGLLLWGLHATESKFTVQTAIVSLLTWDVLWLHNHNGRKCSATIFSAGNYLLRSTFAGKAGEQVSHTEPVMDWSCSMACRPPALLLRGMMRWVGRDEMPLTLWVLQEELPCSSPGSPRGAACRAWALGGSKGLAACWVGVLESERRKKKENTFWKKPCQTIPVVGSAFSVRCKCVILSFLQQFQVASLIRDLF